MLNRDAERITVKGDKNLGVIPAANSYWPKNHNGVSASFVQKCRQEEGVPPVPSGRWMGVLEIRARIIEDPDVKTAPYSYFVEKYDTSRYNVGRAFKEGNIERETPNFHPKEHIMPWRTGLIDNWKRPKGIDRHLEYLRDQA